MKKIFLSILLPLLCYGQNSSENYILTKTYRTESSAISHSTSVADFEVNYFDGLGRPIQKVLRNASATGKNMVSFTTYDDYGRAAQKFLPYKRDTDNLDITPFPVIMAKTFYASPTLQTTGNPKFEATSYPYGETVFDGSPLNRPKKVSHPGDPWRIADDPNDDDNSIELDYLINSEDELKSFQVSSTWDTARGIFIASFSPSGSYPADRLHKRITRDENHGPGYGNNHTVEEFYDTAGKIILKRNYAMGVPHDTYYLYDPAGNLVFVLPPLSIGDGSDADNDGLCYQYRYDSRDRVVEKKLPGKQWEFIVYDKKNRVAATGPSHSPFQNIQAAGWNIIKYDPFDRPILTGWTFSSAPNAANRKQLQDYFDSQTYNLSESKAPATDINGIPVLYSNAVWPFNFHVLSINYYDDYLFPGAPQQIPNHIIPERPQQVYYNSARTPKGLQTGTWTRVPEFSYQYLGSTSYYLYDQKGRQIRSHHMNYLGGYTQTDSKIDFSGKTLYTLTEHRRTQSSDPLLIRESFEYTPQNRLLARTHEINGESTKLLHKNHYDEIGQLIRKEIGGEYARGSEAFQQVDYSYNIRGWLREINDTDILSKPGSPTDLFSFKINYDLTANAAPLFNGNIAETFWRTASDDVLRKYEYTYDPMNRLIDATYRKPSGVRGPNAYGERASYDKNGNIKTMERYGEFDDDLLGLKIDELAYAYDPQQPNRLLKVTDATNNPHGFKDDSDGTNDIADDYSYDSYGNMTRDENKGILSISYNNFNLPVKIETSRGNIEYLYDGNGIKIRKTVTEFGRPVKIQDYFSGILYGNGELEAIPTAEGYVKNTIVANSNRFNYVYNYTDHLGNIRLSYGQDPETQEVKILEENNYYPFGLKHRNYNMSERVYRKLGAGVILDPVCANCLIPFKYNYKFQGQERQDELGLNWDSFKWRNYDYAIGRFMNIDPLTEQYNTWSPYVFSGNRVIDARELEGLEPHILHDDLQEAARNFSTQYNGYSIENNVEIAAQFYRTESGQYSYTTPMMFGQGLSVPGESNDFPANVVPVGDAHTHGDEINSVFVEANVTSGGPLTEKQMSKLTLNDFGNGPWQYQVSNGDNAPSGNDTQAISHPNTDSGNFMRSYVFTPSGLAYSGRLSKDGKTIIYSVNYNLSKTNPSASDSKLNINTVPSTTIPDKLPPQGTIKID